MATPEELAAAEAAAKATAAAYNAANPTGAETPEEEAARIAAAELNGLQGSVDHDGNPAVRADTPEELAAIAEKEAAEKAKAEAEAAAAAEAAMTPEEKEAKAAEAKAAEDKIKADAAANTDDTWITTENKEFNAAILTMKEAGMTAAEASLVFDGAMQSGDMSKVNMDLLVEKLGQTQADLVVGGFTSFAAAEGQAVLERQKSIHDAVGGSENWLQMVTWARSAAKGDEALTTKINDLNAMMNGDSITGAQLAAKEFMGMFNADPKNSTVAPKPATVVDVHAVPATPAATTVEALSPRQYAEAVQDANRTMRGGELQAKLALLSKGRAKGRAQGI